MANTRVTIKDEIEINLTLKVKFDQASFYGDMTKAELDKQLEVAKNNMKEQILSMVEDEYCQQQLSPGVYYDYKIENIAL